jgi:hypothetical protein
VSNIAGAKPNNMSGRLRLPIGVVSGTGHLQYPAW